jgi:hypothetical protein
MKPFHHGSISKQVNRYRVCHNGYIRAGRAVGVTVSSGFVVEELKGRDNVIRPWFTYLQFVGI